MYTVKGDGIVIYSDIQTTESRKASLVKLTLKDNASGSLEITLPPGNAGYNTLTRMTSEIVVYRDKEAIWSGRILSEQMDFWNNRILTCEGELSYLCDSIQPQTKYKKGTTVGSFLESLLSNHNAKYGESDERYKFHIDTSIAEIYNYDEELPEIITDFCNTFDAINTNIIEEFDCHLVIAKQDGKKYIKIVKNEATFNENTQTIRFGENLLDFTKNWDLSDVGTVLIPKGKTLETDSEDGFTKYVTLSDIPLDNEIAKSDTGYYKRTCDDCGNELAYESKSTGGIKYYHCTDCGKWFTDASELADETTLVHEDPDDPTSDLVYVYYDKTDDSGDVVYKYKKDDDGYITLETIKIKVNGVETEKPLIRVNTNESTDTTTIVEYLEYDENGNAEITCKIETDKTYADVYMKDEDGNFYSLKERYGRIEQVVNFSEAEDSVALVKKVFEYIKDNRFDRMTLSISAVDMRYLTGSAEPIRILDRVRCISRPHGMNALFTVTELSIELDKPDSAEYTLEKTIAGTSVSATSITHEISAATAELDPQSPSSILQNAKSTANRVLQEHINGYVTLVTDSEGGRHSESLVISSSRNYKRSENFWVWNINGLGHYTEDYGGEAAPSSTEEDKTIDFWDNGNVYKLNLGITMDGAIVANRITVGQMSADRVRTGTLVSQDGNVIWNLNADEITYEGEIIPGGSMAIRKGSIKLGDTNTTDSDGNKIYNFTVTDEGYLTAISGEIGGFEISGDSLSNDGMTLDENGLTFTYIEDSKTKKLGDIGTSEWENDEDQKILAMNLESDGAAIIWGVKEKSNSDTFSAKLVYANQTNSKYGFKKSDCFYFNAPISDATYTGHSSITWVEGSKAKDINLIANLKLNDDGTVKSFDYFPCYIINGVIMR